MNAIFRFIEDVGTDKIEQLIVSADEVDMRSEDGRHWFVAWKGEHVVATVNVEFVKYWYME